MERDAYIAAIAQAFAVHPVVAIFGPRQCGKTTLARMYAEAKGVDVGTVTHLDLEDPTDQTRLEDPKLFLERLELPVRSIFHETRELGYLRKNVPIVLWRDQVGQGKNGKKERERKWQIRLHLQMCRWKMSVLMTSQ